MIEIDPERTAVDIAITCHDFGAALAFYRDTLGFEVVVDTEISNEVATGIGLAPSGFRHVRLRAGSSLIKLMEIEHSPPPASHEFAAGVRWLTIYVKDVSAVVSDLTPKGVSFMGKPLRGEHATAVAAVAPDGLLIEFAQF